MTPTSSNMICLRRHFLWPLLCGKELMRKVHTAPTYILQSPGSWCRGFKKGSVNEVGIPEASSGVSVRGRLTHDRLPPT